MASQRDKHLQKHKRPGGHDKLAGRDFGPEEGVEQIAENEGEDEIEASRLRDRTYRLLTKV
jgi:hypothetical protein